MTTDVQAKELKEVIRANIVARRAELGLTQTEVAEAAGVTQPYITQIETGLKVPAIEVLASISEALRTTPSALMTPEIFSKTG